MTHQTFLYRYRNLIRMKFLFGLCPFRLSCVDPLHPDTLEALVTVPTTLYTAAYILSASLSYFCLVALEFQKRPTSGLSGTHYVTKFLEHSTVFVVSTAVLCLSWHNRQRHAHLLNTVASVIDRMETTYIARPTTLNVWHGGAWLLMCYAFTFSSMMVFGQFAIDGREIAYYMLLNGAICTMFAVVQQVRDLVGLLADVRMTCVEMLITAQKTTMTAVDDDFADQAIELMIDVQRCAVDVMRCFGGHLFLCKSKDFIFLTTIAFYVMAEMAFSRRGPDWRMLYLVLTYFVPILMNDFMLVRAFDRLDRELDRFLRALSSRYQIMTDERIGLDTILHHNLHAGRKELLVCGFFPINNSFLYKMIAAVFSHLLVLLQFQQWEENQII